MFATSELLANTRFRRHEAVAGRHRLPITVPLSVIAATAVALLGVAGQTAQVPESDGGNGSSSTAGIVGGVVGGVVGLGILICFLYMKCIRKAKPPPADTTPASLYLKTGFLGDQELAPGTSVNNGTPPTERVPSSTAPPSVPSSGFSSLEDVRAATKGYLQSVNQAKSAVKK